ncbi:MAG: diphthine--ammonia ligase [Crocinitomicaceae bacterium]|nr:diphthine--ammonia ligase [Crocinitomicaceae bacterium]
MKAKRKAVCNWSGGKDSALALQKVILEKTYEVIALLTTIDREENASTMHAIPLSILQAQAESIGIPLHVVNLNFKLEDDQQEMLHAINHFQELGVTHFIFGDIFLEDVRTYREEKLNPYGIEAVFPLWNKTSEQVMTEFLASGIEAKIIVTDASKLADSFIGKKLTPSLIDTFPPEMDCCGELGEYHTLAYNAPIFRQKIPFEIRATKKRSHHIGMEDGTTQQFDYWQAILKE